MKVWMNFFSILYISMPLIFGTISIFLESVLFASFEEDDFSESSK